MMLSEKRQDVKNTFPKFLMVPLLAAAIGCSKKEAPTISHSSIEREPPANSVKSHMVLEERDASIMQASVFVFEPIADAGNTLEKVMVRILSECANEKDRQRCITARNAELISSPTSLGNSIDGAHIFFEIREGSRWSLIPQCSDVIANVPTPQRTSSGHELPTYYYALCDASSIQRPAVLRATFSPMGQSVNGKELLSSTAEYEIR